MGLNGFDVYIRKVVEDGKVIFPEAFCLTEEERIEALARGEKLESIERLKKTNRSKFYGQYLNDPLDEEMLEFKREWFQHFTPSPELSSKFQQAPTLISVDPAFRLKQTADSSGIVVSKTLPDNNVYLLEAKGIKVTPKGLVEEIFRLVQTYGNVYKVLVETVTSQIMLMDLLQDEMKRTGVYFVIEEVKPDSNEIKTMRIRHLIPHYANRRIFHAPHLVTLEEQLIEFPKGAHDDIIDALAYQVKYWRGQQQGTPPVQAPEGSYAWWHKKISKRPNVMGKLFNDFRR